MLPGPLNLSQIIGGLSFGYPQSAKAESARSQFYIKDGFYSFNISGDFGIEISLMKKTSLLINGLYSYGLTKISRYMDSRTRDISINVGFLYKL